MANSKIPAIATINPEYDLLSTANFALTGSTSTQMDSTTLTNGMYVVLTAQTTSSQNGVYSCAVSGGSYTLSLYQSFNSSTTNDTPIIFHVVSGGSNSGWWNFVNNNSTGSFTEFITPFLLTTNVLNSNTTLGTTAYQQLVQIGTTGLTITLPVTHTTGAVFNIKMQNVALSTIATSSGTIDGNTTYTMVAYESLSLYDDGTNYWLI